MDQKTVRPLRKRIRNTYDFDISKFGEHPEGKSMTIANEAFSIKEILERWTVGLDPSVSRTVIEGDHEADFDDIDMEKLNRMDKPSQLRIHAEHLDKVKRAKVALQEAGKNLQKAEAEKARAEAEAKAEKEAKAERQRKAANKPENDDN